MLDFLPHWLVTLFFAGCLSFPFVLYNVFQCGALNPNTTEPFIFYQWITNGLNLLAVGGFLWYVDYPMLAKALLGGGGMFVVMGEISLAVWYRQNRDYTWRVFWRKKVKPRDTARGVHDVKNDAA